MKTLEEFEEFYNTNLIYDLKKLEKERKRVKPYLTFTYILTGIVFITLTVIFQHFIVAFFISLILYSILDWYFSRNFDKQFKEKIMPKVIKFLDSNLNYSYHKHVSEEDFKKSKLFRKSHDSYKGEDYIYGKIDNVNIEFSELDVTYHSGEDTETLFDGVFFIADFHKKFDGETIVLPDTAEKLFGGFGTSIQKLFSFENELIKLEDPEFEKMFAVYGDNQVTSRYVLSTSLMRRIIDFSKKFNKQIRISFIDSKVYLAIPFSRDLWEASIGKTVLDFEMFKEYHEYLELFTDIVHDLNLNTNVWSKEK